jgi:hypothetical protein
MNLLDTRTIYGIGSGRSNIYEAPAGDGFVIEVVCNKGAVSIPVNKITCEKFETVEAEAWHTWLHPFDRESRLSIPGSEPAEFAKVTLAEYAALELVEVEGEVEA